MDNISSTTLILILVCVVAIAAVGWLLFQRNRTQTLKSRFGPEYDRAMQEHGNAGRAEAVLEKRAKRVEKFKIIALTDADRERFTQAWKEDQARFVDDPKSAVNGADSILTNVMKTRGYPMGEFEQMASDVSVDHPQVVENYRVAHAIAVRSEKGQADTEELRKAMVHYRALFEDLLGNQASPSLEKR